MDLDPELSVEHTLTAHPRVAEILLGDALAEVVMLELSSRFSAKKWSR
jgi:hypothetical protein